MSEKISIEVIGGAEGHCLCINGYRVCGPKPWSGGRVVETWKADIDNLRSALPPDPRAATIARLTAELVEARERERVLRGVIRGIQRIQSDTEQCRRTRGISHVELVGALDEIGVCCSRALAPKP